MEIKMYREILKYLKNQREVLKSFEEENYYYQGDPNIQKLLNSLYYNINFLDKNIERIVSE